MFYQESKFLGGDMEHTHLVKGLDYALLQKVRSEIQHKEVEQEAEMERLATQALETAVFIMNYKLVNLIHFLKVHYLIGKC